MPENDFKIIINDILNNKDIQWTFSGAQTIKTVFEKYPNAAMKWIKDGRLNKFEKGEMRIESLNTIIKYSSDDETIIKGFKTFFDFDYINKYGYGLINHKIDLLLNTLNEKSDDIQKSVLKSHVYTVFIKLINYDVFQKHFEKGYLDTQIIKNYSIILLRTSSEMLLSTLSNITNSKLTDIMITTNNEILTIVTENRPELLPKTITDLFLF